MMDDPHMNYWDMRSGLIPRVDPLANQARADKAVRWETLTADAHGITDELPPSYLRAGSPIGAGGSSSSVNSRVGLQTKPVTACDYLQSISPIRSTDSSNWPQPPSISNLTPPTGGASDRPFDCDARSVLSTSNKQPASVITTPSTAHPAVI